MTSQLISATDASLNVAIDEADSTSSFNPFLPRDILNFIDEDTNRDGIYGIANSDVDPFDIYGTTYGTLVPEKDELLVREGGYEPRAIRVYKSLMYDQAVSSSYTKLIQEIVGRQYEISSFVESGKINASKQSQEEKDLIERCFDMFDFDNFCSELLEAYITGISYQELFFRKVKGEILLGAHRYRDQSRFKFSKRGKLYLINRNGQYADISKYSPNFLYFRYYHAPHRNYYGLGLGRVLFHPVLFLRRAIESWLYTAERYALPITHVTYQGDAKLKERMALFSKLRKLSRNKTLMTPNTWSVNFVDANAKADFFLEQINMYSDMINLLICGEAVTGESITGGSYGKDAISKSLLVMRAKFLSEKLAFTLNSTIIKYLIDINFPDRDNSMGYPRISFGFPDLDDKPELGEVLAIHQIKPVDFSWVAKTYGIQFASEEQIRQQIKEDNDKNVFQQIEQAKAQLKLSQDPHIAVVSQSQTEAAEVVGGNTDPGADPSQQVGEAPVPGSGQEQQDPFSSLQEGN